MITGRTTVIAHFGYPTEHFKAPMIYNPWFEAKGIDVAVVPLGLTGKDYLEVLRPLFRVTNMHGALVTMPNKVTTVRLVDELTTTAKVAGSAGRPVSLPEWHDSDLKKQAPDLFSDARSMFPGIRSPSLGIVSRDQQTVKP